MLMPRVQVAMWFGTTPDEALVDPGFPRRFVPRAFDAILRHSCAKLLPEFNPPTSPTSHPPTPLDLGANEEIVPLPATAEELVFSPVPNELGACQSALIETRAALTKMNRQRDELRVALDSIAGIAAQSRSVRATP